MDTAKAIVARLLATQKVTDPWAKTAGWGLSGDRRD
jgi:hypothetical protein